MGERSQVYIRSNGKLVLARHYQYNSSVDMISRARWGIQWLSKRMSPSPPYFWSLDNPYVPMEPLRLTRILDVNFDTCDVVLGCDLFNETPNDGTPRWNEAIFNQQDCNDGQLFIDIRENKIFYCFRTNELFAKPIAMDASEYMDWDAPDWAVLPESATEEPMFDAKTLITCKRNINEISILANRMSDAELVEFLTADYSNCGR